jgi:saccharopine dehydrogenase-like NADP-dependent oxidoreductase
MFREYEVYLESEQDAPISAMMTVTSLSAVTTALLLGENRLKGAGGVYTPETILPKEEYIDRMKSSGVNISVSEYES